jgi:hypothetical protein
MTRLEMLKRLLIDNNKLLVKEQDVICLKEASFSATAAKVGLWALLKVRLNRVLTRTLIKEWLEVGYNFAA